MHQLIIFDDEMAVVGGFRGAGSPRMRALVLALRAAALRWAVVGTGSAAERVAPRLQVREGLRIRTKIEWRVLSENQETAQTHCRGWASVLNAGRAGSQPHSSQPA